MPEQPTSLPGRFPRKRPRSDPKYLRGRQLRDPAGARRVAHRPILESSARDSGGKAMPTQPTEGSEVAPPLATGGTLTRLCHPGALIGQILDETGRRGDEAL